MHGDSRGDSQVDNRRDDDRRDGALDVPVGPVADGLAGRRRAGLVLSAAVVVVVVAIGLALLPPKGDPALNGDVANQDAPLPAALASPSGPRPSPSGAAPRSSSSRHEALLALANEPLVGAPNPVLVERRGNDARVVAWNPGDPLRVIRTIPNAFHTDGGIAFLSPDASLLLVATFDASTTESQETARLLRLDGTVAWEAAGIRTIRGIAWSSDSRKVALAGEPGVWWVVSMDPNGVAKPERVLLKDERPTTNRSSAAPSPPSPGATSPASPLDLAPVGFSSDDLWLYGAEVAGDNSGFDSTVRVAIPAGTVESMSGYSSSGPARLVGGAGGIDPTSGRSVRWGPNASIPGGPPTAEVTETDGTLAYRIQTGVVFGTAWQQTGGLVILDADGVPFPTTLRLLSVAPDGTVGPAVLTTGPIGFGGLVGVRDGFAVLGFGTQLPTTATQLVVVNLSNGAASGLTLPPEEVGILGAGLLP